MQKYGSQTAHTGSQITLGIYPFEGGLSSSCLLSQPGTCAVALRASFSTCTMRSAMNFLQASHRLSLSEHVTPSRQTSQMKPYSTLVWQNWQKFIIEDGVYLDAVRGASPIGLSMSKRKILG